MNVNEYIESGILDVYVLGGLSPAECAEVEAYASKFSEIKNEIDAIRSSIEGLTLKNDIIPSSQIKKELFNKIDLASKSSKDPSHNLYNTGGKEIKIPFFAIAASWFITFVCGGIAVYYHQQWQHSEGKYTALLNENKELAANFNVTKNSYQRASEQLAVINDTSLKVITLKSLPGKPNAFAQVLWTKSRHKIYISTNTLPAAAEGMQYQLWAIVNGKPVDAGVLPLDNTEQISRMKDVAEASAFAVTLEKAGGSPVPTMEQMYLMGII